MLQGLLLGSGMLSWMEVLGGRALRTATMSRPLVKVLRLPRNFGVKETLVLEEALLRHDPSNSNWLIQVLVAMLSVSHDALDLRP